MTTRFRPIHCQFGGLRHAGERMRPGDGRRAFASPTNEQMTAMAAGHSTRVARPVAGLARVL
ncbi:hypothetical protein J5J10_11600 [Ciceribacter sp. L1K23]|uniref:hypothetical protein n=1 Tax=unclassified Ciceribacter TaxID=2628820 RepID=UPI001ABED0ED|nr:MULTISPECIES: hypothetical protein [unclassified Ciceribacter]MBO3759522.1 hypothetical protein [Ciceribacter sp. L1K22]MBR0556322.1 hypothetical protein [Ciceribacter sp. L1K23]